MSKPGQKELQQLIGVAKRDRREDVTIDRRAKGRSGYLHACGAQPRTDCWRSDTIYGPARLNRLTTKDRGLHSKTRKIDFSSVVASIA